MSDKSEINIKRPLLSLYSDSHERSLLFYSAYVGVSSEYRKLRKNLSQLYSLKNLMRVKRVNYVYCIYEKYIETKRLTKQTKIQNPLMTFRALFSNPPMA